MGQGQIFSISVPEIAQKIIVIFEKVYALGSWFGMIALGDE